MKKLSLKNSESHWLNVHEDMKIKVDYPTLEQEDELDELRELALRPMVERSNELAEKEKKKLESEGLSGEDLENALARQLTILTSTYINTKAYNKYRRYTVKYSVKDWENFGIDCKLINGALDDELLRLLWQNKELFDAVFRAIKNETEFTETDKKKSDTQAE